MNTVPCPEKLLLACYRIRLLAGPEGLSLPPYKGSTLRGGFAGTFQRLACGTGTRQCKSCSLRHQCPYALVFETGPPPDSEALRNYESVPRPFVLEPPLETKTEYAPGELLIFHLLLFGHALNFFPYFIVTLDELGRRGIGRGCRPFLLAAVEAVNPLTGEEVPVYQSGDRVIRVSDLSFTAGDVWKFSKMASQSARLRLDFITPTRLTFEGKPAAVPEFHVLVRNLLRRLSSLCYFHQAFTYEADFRALIARAQVVRMLRYSTRWVTWERYSTRQGRKVPCGGVVGWALYEGPWAEFYPLLLLGEFLHVGKGTVFGQGKYKVVEISDGRAKT
ncbi:CRISPR system precrRNA processing endoribonuclease RAMP protein Cas6 [Desulfothermobacter acidiphilus]|uniref:CRISPR system precrRNA processing endoribonuclease RAMP protein Cas6 n=1 Tax=Desulfothermobacter acidiphilus TaxID=1938353 RepID=UPI003F8B03C6